MQRALLQPHRRRRGGNPPRGSRDSRKALPNGGACPGAYTMRPYAQNRWHAAVDGMRCTRKACGRAMRAPTGWTAMLHLFPSAWRESDMNETHRNARRALGEVAGRRPDGGVNNPPVSLRLTAPFTQGGLFCAARVGVRWPQVRRGSPLGGRLIVAPTVGALTQVRRESPPWRLRASYRAHAWR